MSGADSAPLRSFPHLLEVCGRLDLAHGLHEGVPHNDADVGAGVALGLECQLPQVGVVQAVRRVAQVQTEHGRPRRLLRQRDVDALLKPDWTKGQENHNTVINTKIDLLPSYPRELTIDIKH